MLAINKFVTLLDEDLLNTRNKPKELPNSAMMKITAYADVMPIFISVRLKEFERVEFGPCVTLVPKRRGKFIKHLEIQLITNISESKLQVDSIRAKVFI